MVRLLGIGILLFMAGSCQYFETEKISSETFYEEKLKTIDWDNVDQYPAFQSCEHHIEKEAQKHCFESTISTHMHEQIATKPMITNSDLQSTVEVRIAISKSGTISNVEVVMDSLLQEKIPLLESWLRSGIETLPSMAPAYKRGIPVDTQFTLPIIIATN